MSPERTPTERAHEHRFLGIESRLIKVELDIVDLKEIAAVSAEKHERVAEMREQTTRIEDKLDDMLERIHNIELSPARKYEKAEAVVFTALATGLITYLLTVFLGGQL